jgi:hypothetical protein
MSLGTAREGGGYYQEGESGKCDQISGEIRTKEPDKVHGSNTIEVREVLVCLVDLVLPWFRDLLRAQKMSSICHMGPCRSMTSEGAESCSFLRPLWDN